MKCQLSSYLPDVFFVTPTCRLLCALALASCYNADSTQGKCCQPGSTIGNEGGIPLCSPPTALAGNVAGNLNTCIKPVRTGCGGLKACSPAATSQTTSRVGVSN
mmetsp:Transcript_74761/g.200377  ORF Transcript_74761/g.200377 Transcript_74761/m.200377 type:complete len:104 (-) Transcript_74761:389-700(-)